jgi:hypothetical protein
MNETKEGIKGSYKSLWIAFESLKGKDLIKQAKTKFWRGREYPQFWLTDRGILLALYLGADPQTVLTKTIEIYPEDKDSQFLIEFASVFRRRARNALYLATISERPITDIDSIFLISRQMLRMSPEEGRQYIARLRNYPAQYERFSETVKQATKTLTKFANLLQSRNLTK